MRDGSLCDQVFKQLLSFSFSQLTFSLSTPPCKIFHSNNHPEQWHLIADLVKNQKNSNKPLTSQQTCCFSSFFLSEGIRGPDSTEIVIGRSASFAVVPASVAVAVAIVAVAEAKGYGWRLEKRFAV